MQTDEELFAQELAKCMPEGHSKHDKNDGTVWCPWAYKRVRISHNHRDWPICSGCLRIIDMEQV